MSHLHRCPKCNAVAHMMAGALVPGGDKSEIYDVCWKHRLAQKRERNPKWLRFEDIGAVEQPATGTQRNGMWREARGTRR